MFNRDVSRDTFLKWKGANTPVTIQSITIGHKGIHFFNSFCGSKIIKCGSVNFQMSDDAPTLVNIIKDKTTGLYSVKGQIKWISEKRPLPQETTEAPPKYAWDAIFLDTSGDIRISIWNEQKDLLDEHSSYLITFVSLRKYFETKLTTTTMTAINKLQTDQSLEWSTVDLTKYPVDTSQQKHKLSSPEIISSKICFSNMYQQYLRQQTRTHRI